MKCRQEIIGEGMDNAMSKVYWNTPDGGGNKSRLAGIKNPKINMDNPFWQRWSTPRWERERGDK